MCLLVATLAFSQKPVISFDVTNYDFGKINEEDGKATYVFNFTNKGNAPMVVSRVQASCGCTTPTWTKEPIAPGKKGSITVTYNPLGRPGIFTKTITVYSNAADEQTTLIIRGEVIPKPTSKNDSYPVQMGDLGLQNKTIMMNNVEKGKTQTREITIQNTGKNNLRPTLENLPAYLTATVSPEIIKPNEAGKIKVSFLSKNCPQWGPTNDEIYVVLNGNKKFSDEYQLRVIANVIENFSSLTPDQKRKAPILETIGRTVNIGIVKAGAKKAAKFKISNKGINPLEIRRIINNNREVTVTKSKMTIAGGKSEQLLLNVDAKNLAAGEYKKTITIQTNDPDNSFIILVLNWSVQK